MRTFIVLFVFGAFLSFSCQDHQRMEDRWQLVWKDEFSQEGLPDPDKWSYDVGYIANNEKQYYTEARPENARIENGNLIIEARKETWTYGRFEVRAKLPRGVGTWPAIWMLGDNISEVGWPACGEIDIMEYVGFDPNTIHANIHTAAYNHSIGTNKGASIEINRPWEEYHIYAVEWYEDRMEFFVDDQKYFTFEKESSDDDVWPFDKPHYLLLNLAIGGDWGGQEGIDDSIFPQQMVIDYVRIYQKKSGECKSNSV